jgi:hypothetical protein
MSVFAAVLIPALLLVLALVVDAADKTRAVVHADALAAEAGRAAASAVDTRGTTLTVNAAAGTAAAQEYLAATGHTGTVDWTPSAVRVTVAYDQPAVIGLLGSSWHVTGTATVSLTVGTSTGETP